MKGGCLERKVDSVIGTENPTYLAREETMKREYPEYPILGVGGIIFHHDTVLLARRGHEPGKGMWSLPGGAVELGESLEDALKREIFEEVSIRIEMGGLVRVLEKIVPDEEGRIRFHYVIADYWGWVVKGVPKPGSDVSAIRFVDIDTIASQDIQEEIKDTLLMAIAMRNGS